ncbi:MAG: hypothetical protein HKN85_13175 [Gammaproteobacteria bacterium]|nr:hypothetical protein [Gammaproteobacteria bacterium]
MMLVFRILPINVDLAKRSMGQARMDFDEIHFDDYPWPEFTGYSSVALSIVQGVVLYQGQSD